MAKYVENVVFFMGYLKNTIPKQNYKGLDIFQGKNINYLIEINDKKLLRDIERKLEIISQKDTKNTINIYKLLLTLSIYGICNLRIYCSSEKEIDPDTFSFDDIHGEIYKFINDYLKKKNLIEYRRNINSFVEEINGDYRYLYHQHLTSNDSNTKVEWSIYRYNNNTIPEDCLDVDTLLLERHLMYYFFSRCYVNLLEDKKQTTLLPHIRLLLNTNRKLIANHHLLLQELDSKHYIIFKKYIPKHHINDTGKTYDRLENNIEHLSEQIEDERRYKESQTMEKIFLILSLIGLLSFITGLLALIPENSLIACDTNATNTYLLNSYTFALGTPGLIIVLFSFFLFLVLIFWLAKKSIENNLSNFRERK